MKRLFACFGLVLVGALGCAHPAAPSRTIFGRTVRVHIQGCHEVPESALRSVVQIDKPDSPGLVVAPRDVLANDVYRLAAAYFDRGYIMAEVGSPVTSESADGLFVDVAIPIKTEGARYRIEKLTIRDDGKDLRSRISLPDGAWFARDVLLQDIDRLRQDYREQGYADIDIEPETEIDPKAHTVTVHIPVKRGSLVRITRIEVQGNKHISREALIALLGLVEGQPFTEAKSAEARARVFATGKFRSVTLTSFEGKDTSDRIVVLAVEE